jgi:hypothetical protein
LSLWLLIAGGALALPVTEPAPRAQDLLAYPEDGARLGVNPPGFCWTPQASAKRYRLEVRKAGAADVFYSAVETSTVHPPSRAFPPGEYTWQVVYLAANEAATGVSKPRRFTVPPGIPRLVMPDMRVLAKRIVPIRPRMFLAGGRLARLQAAVKAGRVGSWQRLRKSADEAAAEPSYAEPEMYSPGRPEDEEWNRIYTRGKVASAHLARTALAYRITGNEADLRAARRWMLVLASWDPRGITSHRLKLADGTEGNDEASMPMLERMSFAWDWMGDRLTPAERQKVLASVRERGNQVLRKLEKEDFLSHPYYNHEGRALAFLGEAGISFLGDIPEAEQWLGYVVKCYLTSYPGWGADEGGWAQGVSYWSIYVYWLTQFAEAFREVTDVDILQRPFFRNTGYLPVYFHPPYARRAAFGDGGYHAANEAEGLLTGYLGDVFRDPVLKWQAQAVLATSRNTTRWREWCIEDVVDTWRAAGEGPLEPASPVDLDGSRYFSDIGWVAMHSALGDAANDVWAMFKASRFGSFSHSHADQNTFHLNAWGHALAIDSGYYPSYGTPHDNLWTRQTRAHNGILVNGRGQPPFTWEAAGRIEAYERHGIVTVVRGQAAEAYNLPQPVDVARLWKRLLPEPVPPMEPKLNDFRRTAVFVASKTRPVLFIHDSLEAGAATTFDWLLHALNQMKIDSPQGAITLQDGDVRLAVRLAATVPFELSQQGGFPVAPEAATNTAYVLEGEKFTDQWHLRASTRAPAAQVKFLAVLVPYRASEAEPRIERIDRDGSTGFRVAGSEVLAPWGKGRGQLIIDVRDAGTTTHVETQD